MSCTVCGDRPCDCIARSRDLKIGDILPMPARKLVIRPTAPIDNRSSFKPARGPKK